MGEQVASTTDLETHPRKNVEKPKAPTPPPRKPKPTPKKPGEKLNNGPDRRGVAVGSTDQATFLDDGAGSTIANGEAGFSRRMLLETSPAANAIDSSELQLHNIVPSIEEAERQVDRRTVDAQRQDHKSDDFFAGRSTDAIYETAKAWCTAHGLQIKDDISAEQQKFAAFNAWIPTANGYYASLMRLRAQQKMLGAKDTAMLVQQLTAGLGDVGKIGARTQLAHDQGHAGVLQVPAVDGTLDEAAKETTQAGAILNTAYLEFQQTLLAQEKSDVHHQGDKATERLNAINDAKAFVRNAGKTIDIAMSVVDGAPANIATATNGIKRAEATFGAIANRRQLMNGERQTHNPTYVTTDAKGNTVVRNVQTGRDHGMEAKPGEPYVQTATPESSFSISGVSDLAGKIVDFAYSGEVAKINAQLEQIKMHCDIIQSESDAIGTKKQIQTFQNALNSFALRCNEFQRRVEARRQQYLEFGVQLDNFARSDFGSQKAGLSPGKGQERYASIMTVVSTVREVVAIGRSALSGFDSTDKLKKWIRGIFEHRERTDDGRADIPWLKMPGEELSRMVEMYTQVDGFENNVIRELVQLGPVDDAATQILAQLSQGSGGSPRGGLY